MKIPQLAVSNRFVAAAATGLWLSAFCMLLSGCLHFDSLGSRTVKGSGNVVSETRAVSGFDRVTLSGSGQLLMVQGNQESLTIETDDNLLPLIKSGVADGLLRVGPGNVNLGPCKPIRYTLHLKNLKALHLSGSLEARAESLKSDGLLFGISGSCHIEVPRLEAGSFDVQVSGSGDIAVGGKVNRQTIQISGSGNYRAGDFESQSAVIRVSGSGDATVWVRGALDAHVSGSGDIKYYGSPQVSAGVSGSGRVRSLGNK